MTHLQPVHFSRRRQQIDCEGEPGDQLYIVTSGKVKLGRRSSDGQSDRPAIAGPSDMFGELSIFDRGPRRHRDRDLGVHEVDDALRLGPQRLLVGVADRPRSSSGCCGCWPGDCAAPTTTCRHCFTDVGTLVAKQLLRSTRRFGTRYGALRVTHNLTQKELAQLIGASRETVNRVLADFNQHGWILSRRIQHADQRIRIPGTPRLPDSRDEHGGPPPTTATTTTDYPPLQDSKYCS